MKKMFIVAAMFVAASMVACCGEQNAKDGEKACCEQKAECKDECKGECEKAECKGECEKAEAPAAEVAPEAAPEAETK